MVRTDFPILYPESDTFARKVLAVTEEVNRDTAETVSVQSCCIEMEMSQQTLSVAALPA